MEIPQYAPDSPELTTYVPAKLKGNTGKDNFEDLLLQAAKRMKDRLTMSRYGVTCIRRGPGDVMAIPSKPDFEGVFAGSSQFIIEAKVESGASFSLGAEAFKELQYNHMAERARYGVPCFLVIHYNYRKLNKTEDPAFTVALPVHPELQMWRDYESKELKRIPREMALALGTIIPWTMPKGTRKPLPHFI